MISDYSELHKLGHAHSIEAYRDDQLVGGLYGLAMGRVFFGESMFHEVANASKVCLHTWSLFPFHRVSSLLTAKFTRIISKVLGQKKFREANI